MKILKLIAKIFASLLTLVICLSVIYAVYLFVSSGFDPDSVEDGFENIVDRIEYVIEPHAQRLEMVEESIEETVDGVEDSLEGFFDRIGD